MLAINICVPFSGFQTSAPPQIRLISRSGTPQMMMAHDSSPTPPHALANETIALVRDELARYVSGSQDGEALGQALQVAAREARTKRILAEHLLVVLKDVWYGLPEVQRASDPTDQVRMLQRVVTMCIREYYRE